MEEENNEVECNHDMGAYLDQDGVKRCKTCNAPYDDYQIDDFIKIGS